MIWRPDPAAPVGKSEQIGRRFFEIKSLAGALDQARKSKFPMQLFDEKRDAGQVSLDRLGKTSVDKGVRNFVRARCVFASTTMHGSPCFAGWAVVPAKSLYEAPRESEPFPPIASPIPEKDSNSLTENPYHAHVERPSVMNQHKAPSYSTAIALKAIFDHSGHFVEANDIGADGQGDIVGSDDVANAPEKQVPEVVLIRRVWMWLRAMFGPTDSG